MTPAIIHKFTHCFNGPPGSDIQPLHVRAEPPCLISEWEPTIEERAAIAAGRHIELRVMQNVMSPVSLALAPVKCIFCGEPEPSGVHEICASLSDTEPVMADETIVGAICALIYGETGEEFTLRDALKKTCAIFGRVIGITGQ